MTQLTKFVKSYIVNSYDLKKFLGQLSINPADIQSFDVGALYPSIPLPKALECVRRRFLKDTSLSECTDWKPDDIMKLLEICLETHFKTIDQLMGIFIHNLMEHQLGNPSQVRLQIFL